MIAKVKRRWKKAGKTTKIVLLSIVVLLVAIRIALPHVTKYYIVKTLNETEGFEATLEDVDFHLYRGAVVLQELKIYSTDAGEKEPLFFVDEVDASVQWKELFNGEIVGEVYIDRPNLNLVVGVENDSGETTNNFEDAEEVSWQEMVTELMPLTINKIVITDGEVHFKDVDSDPVIDLAATDIQLELKNLNNTQEADSAFFSTGELSALLMGDATLDGSIVMDALDEKGTFDLNMELVNLDMRKLNDFMKKYAYLDIEEGQFSLYTEVAANQGALDGYVKPIIEDLKILSLKKDNNDGPFSIVWQGLTGFGAKLFSNLREDQVASKIEFDGTVEETRINVFKTIGSALVNAFIHPLDKSVDHTISADQLGVN